MAGTATTGAIGPPTPVRVLTGTLVHRGAAMTPVALEEPTCACGQALEWSHAAHCPRCGVTLHS